MKTRRFREAGIATGEVGVTTVLIFVIGLLVLRHFEAKRRASLDCVGLLAAAADGRLVPGARCPVSDAPVAVLKKERRESVSCPDPQNHLSRSPRYEREEGKSWRLEQDLPAASAVPSELVRGTRVLAVSARGAATALEVRPRWWWRYLVGPLLQLLGIVYIIAFFVQVLPKDRAPRGIIVMSLVAAVTFGWLGWNSIPSVEGSEAFEVDPAQGRVTHRRFLFGVERAPRVTEACDGIVFVQVRPKSWSLALLARGPGGRALTELVDGLPEDDAALASRLRGR
jgi:hypothetical protein